MEDNKSKNTIQADKIQGAVQVDNVENITQYYYGNNSAPGYQHKAGQCKNRVSDVRKNNLG